MKKTVLLLMCALALTTTIDAQTLTQSNFTCSLIPQVMGSGTSTRLPVVIRATVSGLAPNTVYRYYTNLATASDFGTTNSGAGNPLFPRTTNFAYTTGASLTAANNYDSLTTDANGNYTGWFAIVNTGNARFTAGNYVYPSIVLDSAGAKRGVVNSRFVANDSILVLGYSTSTGANNGSGIRGNSAAGDKNIIVLYDNINGTGRPVTTCFVESIGTTIASAVPFYASAVQGTSGAWGTILPNTLPGGIKRIEQRSLLTGSIVNTNLSTNGNWGTTNTVSPAAGSTPLVISLVDAPLPVEWKSFSAEQTVSGINLFWSTASELNNHIFEIERSMDDINYTTIGTVKSVGNTNKLTVYSFLDETTAASSILYYRLKQVDKDGVIDYSKTLSVNISYSNPLNSITFTNPFDDLIKVSLPLAALTPVSIVINDITGTTLYTNTQYIHSNSGMDIPTSHLPSGVYFMSIRLNGETFTQKLIKL